MKCFDHLLDDFVSAARTGNLRANTEVQRKVFSVLAKEAAKRGVSINEFDADEPVEYRHKSQFVTT
jgi:hypothetical protein